MEHAVASGKINEPQLATIVLVYSKVAIRNKSTPVIKDSVFKKSLNSVYRYAH